MKMQILIAKHSTTYGALTDGILQRMEGRLASYLDFNCNNITIHQINHSATNEGWLAYFKYFPALTHSFFFSWEFLKYEEKN